MRSKPSRKPASSVWFKNQTQLGACYGRNRKTVQRWRAEGGFPEPRSNGSWLKAEVDAWLAESGRLDDPEIAGDGKPTLAELKARNLTLDNEKREFHIGIMRQTYIPKTLAKQVFSKLVLEGKARCFSAITRIVTLARVAADTPTACAEVQKEMNLVWRSLTDSKWFEPDKVKREAAPKKNEGAAKQG